MARRILVGDVTDPAHEHVRDAARPNGWLSLLGDELLTPAQGGGLFSSYVAWARHKDRWHPVPTRGVQDAIAGRLSWSKACDLVPAQTHRERNVDRGPWR